MNNISSITDTITNNNTIKDKKLKSLEQLMDDLMPDLYDEDVECAYEINITKDTNLNDLIVCLENINEGENNKNNVVFLSSKKNKINKRN